MGEMKLNSTTLSGRSWPATHWATALLVAWASCASPVGAAAQTGDATLHELELWNSTPSRSLAESAATGHLVNGDIRLVPGFAEDVDRYAAKTTGSSVLLRTKAAPLSKVTATMVGTDGARYGRSSSFNLNTDDGHFYGVTLSGLRHGNNAIEVMVNADGGNRKRYRLNVERFGSVAATLRSLEVQGGDGEVSIVPNFDPATLDYIGMMSGSEVRLETGSDPEVEVEVAGRNASRKELSERSSLLDVILGGMGNAKPTTLDGLVPGRNVVTITVSTGDFRVTVYTLHLLVEE